MIRSMRFVSNFLSHNFKCHNLDYFDDDLAFVIMDAKSWRVVVLT